MTGARLRESKLSDVSKAVAVPAYDRSEVTAGIVHLGVGGFHRAHQARYVDDLLAAGVRNWGIVGVGLMPGDVRMRDALAAQDHLYTLVERSPDGSVQGRVIGSIIDYLFAPDSPADVLTLLTDPKIRIVSLTITEGGYHVNQATGGFDASDAGIQADLRPGAEPSTAFGYVVEALARRRSAGVAPFTVMSCDNIAGNGEVARKMMVAFATLRDPELGAWIESEVSFPSSMVDRITPATTDADRDEIGWRFGFEDAWPVVSEPFTQWVLEDRFPQGRPPFQDADVQMVDDVEPYELMKLRLLNASHQALCYLGYLSGYRYAHEVCADPLFVDFLLGYMSEEGTPTLPEVPGVDLPAYRRELIDRFANPHIRDTLARLCAESSDRIPKWLVPVISEQLASGGSVRRSALVVAAWARYAEGIDEQGAPIDIVDNRRAEVMARANAQREDPLAFLRSPDLFGDLVDQPGFTEPYVEALASLHAVGARKTLDTWDR